MPFSPPMPGACRRSWVVVLCVSAIVAVLFPAVGAAQETPGQIERRFEPPLRPRSTLEPLELKTPERLPTEEAIAITFVLTGLVVQGSSVYRDADFLPLYQDYLGKEVSLADVYQITDAITAKYRNDGYILSRAIVPPQRIHEGIVTLQIIEGFIQQVFIEGTVRGRRSLLETYGAKIMRARPLQARVLERYLLLANDLPGVTARAVLRPAVEQPGASDLTLILEHKTIDASVSGDNRGTRFIGPGEVSAGVNLNSLLGLYERTGVQAVIAAPEPGELQYVQFTHDQPLGTEGTALSLYGNHSRSEPGSSLKDLHIVGNNTTVSAAVSHPFIRTRGESFSATGRFTYRDSDTDISGVRQSEDRLRILSVSASYDFADRWGGINLVGVEFSQGLDILGAPKPEQLRTRSGGQSDFHKATGQVLRLQRLAPGWSLLGQATWQYAFDKLLASEEFLLGGAQFGRAYDPAELSGDNGAALKLELQYSHAIGASVLKDVQAYTFYDLGSVIRRKPLDDRDRSQALTSAGIGVRYNVTDYVSGYVEVDKPLSRKVEAEHSRDPRVFFRIAGRF